MSIVEIKVPSPGESITEVEIATWLKSNGDYVELDEDICEVDSDKATLGLPSEAAGTIEILVEEGETVQVGEVVARIDTSAAAPASAGAVEVATEAAAPVAEVAPVVAGDGKPKPNGGNAPIIEIKVPSPGESITEVEIATWLKEDGDYVELDEDICEVDSDKATLGLPSEAAGVITVMVEEGTTVQVGEIVAKIDPNYTAPVVAATSTPAASVTVPIPVAASKAAPVASKISHAAGHAGPAAAKLAREAGVDLAKVNGSGKEGRVLQSDVVDYIAAGFNVGDVAQGWGGTREESSKKMKALRRKIAERLVAVKQETAMLTTFNEVDMKPIMDIRKQYKEKFKETHGVGVGFMSFFTKAVTEALRQFPDVNAMIDDDHIVSFDYADIGIAVSGPKVLMVPVLRNAEQMSLAEIEAEIRRLALKSRDGKLTIQEMTGGTFTITNGGVFGSMLSTPIINPPQSAILGMHNIVERPVAINGKVEIRPIMYVALSYDHRIIDGKDSVGFLKTVKDYLENPVSLMFGGKTPEQVLLGL
jgi:2-oxoglutarate dehydrogenase E2 component (dihydrolipoamide succinyltransferase)